MKKLLSISVLLMFLGVMLAADSVYALPQKGKTGQGADEAEGRLDKKGRKGSILDGAIWLIANGIYKNNPISKKDFRDKSGTNPATGEVYSPSTINREISSMLAIGLLEQDADGNLYVPAGINHDVLDAVNQEAEKLIPRKEAGTGQALGLARFNLTDLPAEKLDALKTIVGKTNLINNAAVKIVAFDSDFAENNGQALLNIVDNLRPDQIPVIINATGRELRVIPELSEIHVEPVKPGSTAAEEFAEMFTNQKYVGFKGTIDSLKKNIAEGKVAI